MQFVLPGPLCLIRTHWRSCCVSPVWSSGWNQLQNYSLVGMEEGNFCAKSLVWAAIHLLWRTLWTFCASLQFQVHSCMVEDWPLKSLNCMLPRYSWKIKKGTDVQPWDNSSKVRRDTWVPQCLAHQLQRETVMVVRPQCSFSHILYHQGQMIFK